MPEKSNEPNIMFGRNSNAFKGNERYDYWDMSIEHFDAGRHVESIQYFLLYLGDDGIGNVQMTKGEIDELSFTFLQGSKRIEGSVKEGKLKAFVKIALTTKKETDLYRKILEKNYYLKYCRFSMNQSGMLHLSFTSMLNEASPYQLFYGLCELALVADREDDLILHEYPGLKKVDSGHIRDISEKEKRQKFEFFIDNINKALDILDNSGLDCHQYPGAASYLMLACLFKLDFLIKPEGPVMETIKEIQSTFFQSSSITPQVKIQRMKNNLKELSNVSWEDFEKEMYEVVFTFDVTSPAGKEELKSLIYNELGHMDFYIENGYSVFAQAIPDYIVGYCLYNYSLLPVEKELCLLYYKIREQEFFQNLGYKYSFWKNTNLRKSKIKKEVMKISKNHRNVHVDDSVLQFDDALDFYKSFILMLAGLQIKNK